MCILCSQKSFATALPLGLPTLLYPDVYKYTYKKYVGNYTILTFHFTLTSSIVHDKVKSFIQNL